MSGYLQRLVNTAAGRTGSVRPQTGSIFAPRLEEIRPPLAGWEETEPVRTPHLTMEAPPPRARAVSISHEPAPLRDDAPRSAEHVPLLPRPVAPDGDAMLSIAPDAHAMPPASRPGPAAVNPRQTSIDPLDAPSAESGEAPPRPPAADTAFHVTLTAPSTRGADEAFRPVMRPARAPESGANTVGAARDLTRQRHTAQAAPQSDDIQIHIGRIEVTAVPPPAPRAPKAPDRSVSLDAYLSRRNGGAR